MLFERRNEEMEAYKLKNYWLVRQKYSTSQKCENPPASVYYTAKFYTFLRYYIQITVQRIIIFEI